jgi:LytS/YehU family sensor histidine kinase
MVYRENRDEAYHYFTKFSRLIRAAFDNSEETTRTVKDELKFVKNYLDIEKMRFKNRFDFQITVDKNIITDWKIPKMVIQLYVENAIKHGLLHREYGGMLEVRLSMGDDHLKILIKDNGIGRARAQVLNDQEKSLGKGTKIMNEYFELLNRFNEHKIFSNTFDLFDSDGNAAGTEVLVSIPLSFKYSI